MYILLYYGNINVPCCLENVHLIIMAMYLVVLEMFTEVTESVVVFLLCIHISGRVLNEVYEAVFVNAP